MKAQRVALSLLITAALGVTAPVPADAQTGGRAVAGWRITHGGTGDGGYFAQLARSGRGYRLTHYLEFWRGNGGVSVMASFERGDCRSGDANAIVPFDEGMSRGFFDTRLADYLRECPLPRAEADALRRTLDTAWPLFIALARRERARMEAELRAIMNQGR